MKPESLFLALPCCLLKTEKICSSVLTLIYEQCSNSLAILFPPFSHLHWHFPYCNYLATTPRNTLNGYEKWKCAKRSLEFCVFWKILTHFFPMLLFDPTENIRKPSVFWCFQEGQKGTLGSNGLMLKRSWLLLTNSYNCSYFSKCYPAW